MRRLALLVTAAAALSGCHYVSDPTVGFGGFITDTHTFARNPNLPPGSSENIQRAKGQTVAVEPLLAEPGNIWPGPPKAEPTLEDMIREEQTGPSGLLPGPGSPGLGAPGATPETPVPPASSAHPQPRPIPPGSSSPAPAQPQSPSLPAQPPLPPPARAPSIKVPSPTITTPNGPQVINPGGNGITTTTSPSGTSIIVPNGNGTSTIIGPDGSTQTIPTPK